MTTKKTSKAGKARKASSAKPKKAAAVKSRKTGSKTERARKNRADAKKAPEKQEKGKTTAKKTVRSFEKKPLVAEVKHTMTRQPTAAKPRKSRKIKSEKPAEQTVKAEITETPVQQDEKPVEIKPEISPAFSNTGRTVTAIEPVQKPKLPPRKKNLYLRGGDGSLRKVVKRKKSTDSSRYYVTNAMLLEEMIKWRDSDPDPDKRQPSEEFGKMIMEIARRVTNHQYFRNYTKEMKEDMMGYAYLKIMKGLKGFNFKYTNVFAYLTTACFNAFRTECSKHYKQVNIKNNVTQRYVDKLNVDMPNSSINKSLKTMLDGYEDGYNDEYSAGYDY